MNKLMLIIFTIILLTIIVIGCVGSSKTNNILTGTLYVSGNEPFTHLALKSVDAINYKIECSDSLKKELWQLQGKTVELRYIEMKEFEIQKVAVVTEYTIKEQNIIEEQND